MKKSLLAVAAIGAFASAAQAQSSVSVYGILDAGYIGSSIGGVGTSATNKQTNNSIGQSAESTSRLGFKGSEDMGGGTSAFFTVEIGLMPSSSGSATGNASTWNNRQSFVGLKKNGIGQFAIGTQYTPVFNSGSVTSPGQYNNVTGDVIYATNVLGNGNGAAAANGLPYGNTTNFTTQSSTTSDGFTSRTGNTLSFKTDNFAGFTASGVYVQNDQNTTNTTATYNNAKTNNSGWGLAADYTWKKLYVTAAYQALQNITGSTNTSTIWSASMGGSNIKDNQFLGGATYDFGILKAYAQYVNRKAIDYDNINYTASRTAQQIGVRSFITPTIEGFASAGNGRLNWAGLSGAPTANFIGYQVGGNYLLSKRTNLYTIVGHTQTSSVSGVAGNLYTTQYAVGVRHTF